MSSWDLNCFFMSSSEFTEFWQIKCWWVWRFCWGEPRLQTEKVFKERRESSLNCVYDEQAAVCAAQCVNYKITHSRCYGGFIKPPLFQHYLHHLHRNLDLHLPFHNWCPLHTCLPVRPLVDAIFSRLQQWKSRWALKCESWRKYDYNFTVCGCWPLTDVPKNVGLLLEQNFFFFFFPVRFAEMVPEMQDAIM